MAQMGIPFEIPREYRFRPTEEELLCDHLEKKNKCRDSQIMPLIPEIDLCKHEPRQLPGLAFERQENLGGKRFPGFYFWCTRKESWYSQGEWYFFARREYKYCNSTRSNRTTNEGYWKVTGTDCDIKAPFSKAVIGKKRILTFQKRGAPKSHKTGWVIHEYYQIQPHSNGPKQIGDFVVCCLKYNSNNTDHDEDAPFCNRASGSGSCSVVSDVANQAEENLASNEQVNVVPIPNGNGNEAGTGGGMITEPEEGLTYEKLGDDLQVPNGNQNEFQGSQTDPCNGGQADRKYCSDMIDELLDDPENLVSLFYPPAPPQLHQVHQSLMYTTNVHNDECRKRNYPFEDNDSSLTKKSNISTNDGDELVSNTTSNSENQAEGDSVICRRKNKSDKKDSLISDEGEPDSAGVSNWNVQAAHKNDEPLFHQPQPLDDCRSSAVQSCSFLKLEAVLQAIGTNDDCNKLPSPRGDSTFCLEDKNEVSNCDEDETMDGVCSQLCDPPEVNLDFLRPLQPNQATDSRIPEVRRQTKEDMESAFYPGQPEECNEWQSYLSAEIA